MNSYQENTLVTGFIKNLLLNSPLPTIETVHEGHMLIQGVRYIYKSNIIE